jgi:ribonuclease P protein component
MLPTSSRLPKQLFSVVFKQGTRIHTSYFQFISKLNKESYSRLGIVIGKRTAKSAVSRNRIKRMIRNTFQSVQHTIHPPSDVICIVKQDCSMKHHSDIEQQIRAITKHIT